MNAHALPNPVVATRARPRWQHDPLVAYPAFILLAILLVARFNLGPTGLHDSLAIYWVWADQFATQLAHGALYPRWLPQSDGGLGTPVFYFYPPFAFYLTAIFQLAGVSTVNSLLAAFATGFAASGITCWHWLKRTTSQPLLASALFMAAPYHLFNYTERGALAELVGTAFIPLIAIGLRRIAEQRRGVALSACSYAGLILTHLPLALLTSLFLIAPYAIAHRRRLAAFATAVAAGIGLAAIYLVPALALAPYHDGQQLYRAANLRTDYWSITSGNWQEVTYSASFLIIAALALAAAILLARQLRNRWAALSLAVTIVVSGAIPLIWQLPLLRDVQFPFRALPIAEFAFVTALATAVDGKSRSWALAAIAPPLLAALLILPGFHSRQVDDPARLAAHHPDTYEYLPRGVLKPNATRTTLDAILAPRIPPPSVSGQIVEPVFYFPSWSCGTPEPRTQLLMHAPTCTPRIVWTFAEKLGAAISLLTLLLLGGASVRRLKPALV